MHTPFIDIYYQLGDKNYFVFFNRLREKLLFSGNHINPKKGCCKTWIEKWNWRCDRESYEYMKISIGKNAPKEFIEDPLGIYNGDIDSEE